MQAPFPLLAQALHDARLDCLITSLTSELVQPDIKHELRIEPLYIGYNRVLWQARAFQWRWRH